MILASASPVSLTMALGAVVAYTVSAASQASQSAARATRAL
ncbi:MAG: cytochrome C assembly protein, partial [Betaproteobacteria bacterium]|nr:cytochrome C assembly protein [Betaproteobacteria bacterium]